MGVMTSGLTQATIIPHGEAAASSPPNKHLIRNNDDIMPANGHPFKIMKLSNTYVGYHPFTQRIGLNPFNDH